MSWKQLGLWLRELENIGFKVKNVIVWDKILHGLNCKNYAYTHEFIIYFTKGTHFPNNKIYIDSKQYYKDVWNIQRKTNIGNEHETTKHPLVVKIPLLHSSTENDIILDPFMGSGTTALLCKQNKRNFIGFEIEEKYVILANKSLKQEVLF